MRTSHLGIKFSIAILFIIILATQMVYWKAVATLTDHTSSIIKISTHLESGEGFHSAVHSMMMDVSDSIHYEQYIKDRDNADEKIDQLKKYLTHLPDSQMKKSLSLITEKMADAYSNFRDYTDEILSEKNDGHMMSAHHLQDLFDSIFIEYKNLHNHHSKQKKEILSRTEAIHKSIRVVLFISLILATTICVLVIIYFDRVILKLFDFTEKLALHDELTGLYNRHSLDRIISNIDSTGHKKRKDGFGILLMDIDHFKKFNDAYGHPGGDKLLKDLAKLLLTSVRKKDYVVRYGGEEFLICLSGTDIQGTKKVAEKICNRIAKNPFDLLDGKGPKKVTASIGFASNSVDEGTFKDLIGISDVRLYEAKNSGRNRAIGPSLPNFQKN